MSSSAPTAPAVLLTRPRLLLLAVLCGVSVANVYYAQPLLERMGSDLSISTGQVGWVVALGQAGYLVGLAALVPLGDWLNRRMLIPAHLLLIAVGTTVAALSTTAAVLYVGVAIAGLFAVVVQTAVAYTAAKSPPEHRGRNIGIVTSGVVVGIILARTVAGFIADVAGWRAVYAAAAVMAVIMAVLIWTALPDDQPSRAPRSYGAAVASILVLGATDRVFRTRSLITFFLFASFGVLWSGLALPLSNAPWHLSPAQIGLFGFAGLAGTLGAARAGRWADRGHSGVVTVVSLIVLIASWWFIGQAEWSLWLVVLGAVLLDFAVQAVHVTNQNLIVARDPDSSSRIIGAYMIFYSLGSALGAVTASSFYDSMGWTAASVAGACFAGAALGIWLIDRVVPDRSTRPGVERAPVSASAEGKQ
ncbi:Predicted arabinose efflux permease, MFS family [Actinopolyspora alba]|uniref:Predicted arabinose efflux permease, MFS family n=1 Tax=Actinopolyspora alba TaxID=673379 RepID=A0A1I2A9U5_9ACTN|nr:MFS transporter [Actinopolyspora alba]SFE40835.1 Predicted arabinose efflux permease, MFS family [Actinopolyspora alba]